MAQMVRRCPWFPALPKHWQWSQSGAPSGAEERDRDPGACLFVRGGDAVRVVVVPPGPEWPVKPDRRQAGRQLDSQAGRQAGGRAGGQAGRQASRPACKQANVQAGQQASRPANQQAGQRGSEAIRQHGKAGRRPAVRSASCILLENEEGVVQSIRKLRICKLRISESEFLEISLWTLEITPSALRICLSQTL